MKGSCGNRLVHVYVAQKTISLQTHGFIAKFCDVNRYGETPSMPNSSNRQWTIRYTDFEIYRSTMLNIGA